MCDEPGSEELHYCTSGATRLLSFLNLWSHSYFQCSSKNTVSFEIYVW